MKKFFNIKTSALVLSLLLILGVTVFAQESTESTATPDIVSYNVVYSDTFKLKVAVKDETVPAGSIVTVNVYDDYPEADSVVLDTFTLTRTAIAQFDGAYFYVGTSNRAVTASALGTEFYMQAQYGEGDSIVKGNVAKYSVAEYLYQKLYLENYVAKTEADGKDYIRKTFYQGVLAFGAGAQHLVLDTAPAYYMDKLSYCVVENGKVNGTNGLLSTPGTALSITYTGAENAQYLTAWNYFGYTSGESKELPVNEDKTLELVAPEEAFKLTPVFKNPYVINFENNTMDDEAKTLTIAAQPSKGLTVGVVPNPTDENDSVYTISGLPTGNTHFRIDFANESNSTGDTYTFEADMYFSSTLADGNKASGNTNFGYIDFRNGNVYALNLYFNANADGVNLKSNVKIGDDYPNVATALPVDAWFKLKIVAYTYTEDGVMKVDSYIYANDKLVGSQIGLTKFGGSNLTTQASTSVNIKINAKTSSTPTDGIVMYLDDIMFTRTESEK